MLISSKNKFGMVKWERSGSAGLFNCGILKFKISNLKSFQRIRTSPQP